MFFPLSFVPIDASSYIARTRTHTPLSLYLRLYRHSSSVTYVSPAAFCPSLSWPSFLSSCRLFTSGRRGGCILCGCLPGRWDGGGSRGMLKGERQDRHSALCIPISFCRAAVGIFSVVHLAGTAPVLHPPAWVSWDAPLPCHVHGVKQGGFLHCNGGERKGKGQQVLPCCWTLGGCGWWEQLKGNHQPHSLPSSSHVSLCGTVHQKSRVAMWQLGKCPVIICFWIESWGQWL